MTIRRRATILSGGRVQIEDPQLPEGAEAEVLVTVDEPADTLSGELEFDPNAKPFWQMVLEIGASIPDEEWEKVPTDLSINLDHYLYGAPKVEE
jgi:hypothetical protein